MSNELHVDHEQLRRSAEGMASVHRQLQDEHQRFLAQLASYGQPWGMNNGVSQAIGSCAPVVQEACDSCHQENHAAYADYPAGLYEQAATHAQAEQAGAALANTQRQV